MRVLVVEDEEVVARRVQRLAKEILSDRLQRLDWADELAEARLRLAEVPYDLVFLDLDLWGRDGFGLLRELGDGSIPVVVISAHTDRALEGFERGVVDFVGKPFGKKRLTIAIERALEQRSTRSRLAVRVGGAIRFVDVAGLVFVRGAGDYAELHLAAGDVSLHDANLGELERVLPRQFYRIHRSYIVDLTRVKSLRCRPGSRYHVELEGEGELPVSRGRVEQVREALLRV